MSEENDEPPGDAYSGEGDEYDGDEYDADDEEGSDEMFWETRASSRVSEILESAELDEESGTVVLQHEDWDPKGRHDTRIF